MSKTTKRRLVSDDDTHNRSTEKNIKSDSNNSATNELHEETLKDDIIEKGGTKRLRADATSEQPGRKRRKIIREDEVEASAEKDSVCEEIGVLDKGATVVSVKHVDKQVGKDESGALLEKSSSLEVISIKTKAECVTKNQCACEDEEVTQSQLLEDHEAHVLVAEWRLHKFQSPIELSHGDSISHDHFEPLEFHGHWDKGGEAVFENTGKTAVLRLQRDPLPYLIGGPLHEDTYVFEQLHFHWSDDDNGGCEHIFEGKAYSMEAHAVHYNRKYGSFEQAQDKPDGLAVIGFFLEATDNDDNPCFKKLTAAVQNIVKVNTSTSVAPDCLTWIKEEAQCKGYYTYQGSLTTEPYLESVTWILYPTPIHVSRQQVAHFRELKSTPCEKVNIVNNVRPVQSPPAHKKLNVFYARSHRKSE